MLPNIAQGTKILAWGGVYVFKKPRIKDVIVFRLGDKHLVKRIVQIYDNGYYYVRGDNLNDSINMSIKPNEVLGKVIFKY